MKSKREVQIALETEAGREGLAVWQTTIQRMSGAQRVEKSFELTEMTRQIMRDGIKDQHPSATETEIQRIYVDRLLSFHGISRIDLESCSAKMIGNQRSNDR